MALPGIGGETPSTASLPVRHLQFAKGAHGAGELQLPRWSDIKCLGLQKSYGRIDCFLISCLGAKFSPVQCAARPAAGEVAQEGTAAATEAAPPTGVLACSMSVACIVLQTCVDWYSLLHLILVVALAAGVHGNPLQVLTGFESSPFKNGGFLFEHHACGCVKLVVMKRIMHAPPTDSSYPAAFQLCPLCSRVYLLLCQQHTLELKTTFCES